uniref:Uncharacterized protein n=1 Tax=Rhizophora mucronata TaxID=61149 RepID=A0A2P2JPF8_RHIMU
MLMFLLHAYPFSFIVYIFMSTQFLCCLSCPSCSVVPG